MIVPWMDLLCEFWESMRMGFWIRSLYIEGMILMYLFGFYDLPISWMFFFGCLCA